MIVIKIITLLLLFLSISYVGILISKKYVNRVSDLKEIKKALNIFSTKMKFTYEPIPRIFDDISKKTKPNISKIFKESADKMNEISAGDAWKQALNHSNTNLKKDDIDTLKTLSNLLGKVDIEGQIGEINLVENFLDTQIDSAEEEKKKYTKMYRTLGITIGLTLVIILI